jgi:hypothetical protein
MARRPSRPKKSKAKKSLLYYELLKSVFVGLNHLIYCGYVDQMEGKKGLRFYITDKGRTLLYEYDQNPDSDIREESIEKKYLGSDD